MSDSISGRVVRQGGRSKRIVLEFEGKMKGDDWDKFIERMRTVLKTEFKDAVKLSEVGAAAGGASPGGGGGGGSGC